MRFVDSRIRNFSILSHFTRLLEWVVRSSNKSPPVAEAEDARHSNMGTGVGPRNFRKGDVGQAPDIAL